jgi:hypothetical protein
MWPLVSGSILYQTLFCITGVVFSYKICEFAVNRTYKSVEVERILE